MKNEKIDSTNKILFETMVSFGREKYDVLFTISEKHLLFQKKKGLFKKKFKVVKDVLVSDIKVINDKVKIENKKNKIIIYTKYGDFSFFCKNILESKKIIEEINKLILGENFLERASKKGVKVLNITKNTAKVVGGVAMAVVGAYTAIKDNKGAIKDAAKTIVDVIKK